MADPIEKLKADCINLMQKEVDKLKAGCEGELLSPKAHAFLRDTIHAVVAIKKAGQATPDNVKYLSDTDLHKLAVEIEAEKEESAA